METRPLSYSSGEHIADLEYLINHLKADPKTLGLVDDAAAAHAALKRQDEIWNEKSNAAAEAQGGVIATDEALDNAVRLAHQTILQDVDQKHRAPKYLAYFPRGLAAIVRAPFHDEVVAVQAIAERCAADPSEKVRALAAPLSSALEQMNAALRRRDEALSGETAAFGQLQIQKVEAIDAARRADHRVAEIYPFERGRVRGFFRTVGRQGRKPEEAPVVAARVTGDAGKLGVKGGSGGDGIGPEIGGPEAVDSKAAA